ncbi:MAG TPA: GNAT family N-acetyltransferase [Vitreimonas sp.]|nr:GNAT family N-acetyltransferase [Vitreimonas sp.]
MSHLEIREATVDDIPAIIDAQLATWIATYAGLGDITKQDIRQIDFHANAPQMQLEIQNAGPHRYWVVASDEQVVGYGYAINNPEKPEIKSLYILPTQQGSGLGSKLMNEMLTFLADHEVVFVDVIALNEGAIRFYERFGFKEYSRRMSTRFLGEAGKTVEVVQMKKVSKGN